MNNLRIKYNRTPRTHVLNALETALDCRISLDNKGWMQVVISNELTPEFNSWWNHYVTTGFLPTVAYQYAQNREEYLYAR